MLKKSYHSLLLSSKLIVGIFCTKKWWWVASRSSRSPGLEDLRWFVLVASFLCPLASKISFFLFKLTLKGRFRLSELLLLCLYHLYGLCPYPWTGKNTIRYTGFPYDQVNIREWIQMFYSTFFTKTKFQNYVIYLRKIQSWYRKYNIYLNDQNYTVIDLNGISSLKSQTAVAHKRQALEIDLNVLVYRYPHCWII